MLSGLLDRGAVIDASGVYRYHLWRRWAPGKTCVYVMLNPSTGDAEKDDATIRVGVGRTARMDGFGSWIAVNLYAYRTTDPGDLNKAAADGIDIVGRYNEGYLLRAIITADLVVMAYGRGNVDGMAMRELAVLNIIDSQRKKPMCLGYTKDKYPLHPLRVPYSKPLEEFYMPPRR